MRKIICALAICTFPLLVLGCGSGGNTVVEPADTAENDEQMREMTADFEGTGGGGGGGGGKQVGN